MMQFVHDGDHPGNSSVMFVLMIDMNPTDVSCIYSTLMFISEHAHRYNVQLFITFDKPLWWKAFLITATEQPNSGLRNIVLCSGGVHTEMSLLGNSDLRNIVLCSGGVHTEMSLLGNSDLRNIVLCSGGVHTEMSLLGNSDLRNIVLCSGGVHTEMSLLGSISMFRRSPH